MLLVPRFSRRVTRSPEGSDRAYTQICSKAGLPSEPAATAGVGGSGGCWRGSDKLPFEFERLFALDEQRIFAIAGIPQGAVDVKPLGTQAFQNCLPEGGGFEDHEVFEFG